MNLFGQFLEEQASSVSDAWVTVHQTQGHFTDGALHLDHVIEYEVCQDNNGILPH